MYNFNFNSQFSYFLSINFIANNINLEYMMYLDKLNLDLRVLF